jgi:TetR/AcrR family transcriptional regulator, transcriptional repressor of aconitase
MAPRKGYVPKVSQSYLDARRAQILDAAVVCFSREGFHQTTMKDIVKQSKLSPGAIYNYFESKEQIIEAIAKERHAKERLLLTEARKNSNIASVLERIRDAFFGELRDPNERLRKRVSIQMWAEAQRNPRILKIVRRGVDGPRKLLSAIISDAQRKGEISIEVDPNAAARFMIAAFQGFVLQMEWDRKINEQPYLRLLDTFLKSLSPSV